MEIASEFASTSASSHAGNDSVANDQGTNVGTVGFSDVFLTQDGFLGVQQSLNEIPRFMIGVAQEHALTLGSLGHLDDDRKATNGFDSVFDIGCITNVDGFWNWNFVSSEQLRSVQFVSALENTLSSVSRPDTHLLKMAKNSYTMSCDGVANARNHRIEGRWASLMHDINAVVINEQ